MPADRPGLLGQGLAERLRQPAPLAAPARVIGEVRAVAGPVIEASAAEARVGDRCALLDPPGGLEGEVVALDQGSAKILALGDTAGIGPGMRVRFGGQAQVLAGPGLLGRVVDAMGRPLDEGPDLSGSGMSPAPLRRAPPSALSRPPIDTQLCTGVRVIDALTPLGYGQRLGLFAGPGVGKSTLLGQIAAGAEVDVVICALIGERGREVREVLDGPLAEARERSVVVVATGDAPPLLRARAALSATALAEWFRDRGARVLLLVDSLTRYARALREIGLAAGERPVRGGFPPSVFSALPRLLERTGTSPQGSITAIYSVLAEGEGAQDPISDEIRGLVDGHLIMSRALAERGHWPAVDAAASLSRVASALQPQQVLAQASQARRMVSLYEERRELVVLGAYEGGADPEADAAVQAWPALARFLQQGPEAHVPLPQTLAALAALQPATATNPEVRP